MNLRHVLGAAAAISLSLMSVQASAQTVTLKYSSWLPLNHWINQTIFNPWFEEIEKVTQGRVKVDVLPKTVGTALTAYDVVRDGLADTSLVVQSYSPGRFVFAEMLELPLLGNDSSTMSVIAERTYNKHFMPKGEFVGTKVLSIFNIVPLQIFNNKRPVATIEDMKGLKLRSPNKSVTTVMNATGGVPILKSSAEAYEMLSTGAIDGQITQADTVVVNNGTGFMKFGTIIPGGLANSCLLIPINPDTWAKISKADQAAIEGITHVKMAQKFGDGFFGQEQKGMKVMLEAGYKIIEADAAFVKALQPSIKTIEDDWVKRSKDKGIADPAAILAEFRTEIAKARRN